MVGNDAAVNCPPFSEAGSRHIDSDHERTLREIEAADAAHPHIPTFVVHSVILPLRDPSCSEPEASPSAPAAEIPSPLGFDTSSLGTPMPRRRIVYTHERRFGPTPVGPIQMAPFPEPPVPDSSGSESDTEIPWDQLSEATRARVLMKRMPTMIHHTVVILKSLSLIRLPAPADIALVHILFSPSWPRPVYTYPSGCVRLSRPILKWMRVSDMSSTLTGGVDDSQCRELPLLRHVILRGDSCCV